MSPHTHTHTNSAALWYGRLVLVRSKEMSTLMFHCSVSTAVIDASLSRVSQTAITLFFSLLSHPGINDDIRVKQNHRLSLLLAFIITAASRREITAACVSNSEIQMHADVVSSHLVFSSSFISQTHHPEADKTRISSLNYSYTHFNRGSVPALISTGCKADFREG